MATQQSIIQRTNAAQRTVLDLLERTFAHPAPRFPTGSRHGREHLNMVQWESLAEWLTALSVTEVTVQGDDVTTITIDYDNALNVAEAIIADIRAEVNADPDDATASDGLDIEPNDTDTYRAADYDAMTRAELLALADERGVAIEGSRPTKADIIEALKNADLND